VSRGDEMEREREDKERESEGSHILPTSCVMVVGVTRSMFDGTGSSVTPQQSA
jgi:hypothetical protein